MLKIVLNLAIASLLLSCRSSQNETGSALESTAPNQVFKNYSGSIVCSPQKIVKPSTIQEVQAAVLEAQKEKANVRVISLPVPKSYSPVICPEVGGTFINVESFNKILSIDANSLTAIVQPGILINQLQDQLNEKGFTFPVTPDYNGVSLGGGMGTGAHHSSLKFATGISDWVEEIKLVDGKGELKTLSGKDMDTARVHLGLLGVIVELKIRILPQYKLKYSLDKGSDAKLDTEILKLVRQHEYARVMWFPSQKTYVLDHFDKVSMDTPGDSYNNLWTSTPNVSWLGDTVIGTLNANQTTQCAAEAIRAKTFFGPFKAVNSDGKAPVGLSHKMIASTCEVGKCSWDHGIKTRTVEIGIEAERLPDWIREVRTMIAAKKACFPILGVYIRFSAASTGALSEAYGHDSAVFEIHIPQISKPTLEPSSDVYDEMVQMTLAKYNGRPHWGKNSQPYFMNLGPEQYPNWKEFQKLRASLDPEGRFVNPFWSQIESKTSSVARTPGCAVAKTCICQIDSDCGPGATCEAGSYFKEAKVCRR
ncbi:MAG: FAD-binding protein [Oligoflexus sp.]|nr:FAD-binding protein [Oligoflexus sp.]